MDHDVRICLWISQKEWRSIKAIQVPSTVSLVELHKSLGEVVDNAAFAYDRTTISRQRKPVAAIVPIADLELLERLGDEADLAALREAEANDDGRRMSLADYMAGKYFDDAAE